MAFQLTPNITVNRDESGRVVSLTHIHEPFRPAALAQQATVRELAAQYLTEVAALYGFEGAMSSSLLETVPGTLQDETQRLHFHAEKRVANVAVVSFKQTWRGLPVWNAVVGVRVNPEAMEVIGSNSQVVDNLKVELPDLENAPYAPERLTSANLARLLRVEPSADEPAITSSDLVVYRYWSQERIRPATPDGPTPDDLPIELPDGRRFPDGSDHVVTKVQFQLSRPEREGMYWTALIEPSSGTVLYLRAHTSDVNGAIFQIDPVTQGCPTCAGSSSAKDLDIYRTQLPLNGLTAPPAGDPQSLTGNFIALQFVSGPPYNPPTEPVGTDFIYSSTTPEFASVNAYYHCDLLYRYVQGMGIDIQTYFDGTTFPIPTDAIALGNQVNAQAKGNAAGNGMGSYVFGVVTSGFTVGIASAYRVVLHEFGHALLWDHVDSPNFGFAHSAGDSMAAIFADPTSEALDKGLTFPFVRLNRRQDRQVADGWAWFGVNYNTQYNGEQILSTTLFRAYQSTGGAADALAFNLFASQYMFYLIVKSCGLLIATTTDPTVYVNALIEADMTTTDFQGQTGGTNYKVIRWSFEKQGLYQPSNTPKPYTRPGVPPPTDVFIDDGRMGEYTYQPNWTSNQNVWNRLAPDGGTSHEEPVSGVVNYAYVRLQNRGTGSASNATVRGFQGRVGSEFNWPADWTALTTAQVAVPAPINSGGTVVLGPFQWTPAASGSGSLLMVASADGDPSIVDNPNIAGATIPNWRLVPFDNNIAQRNVTIG